MQNYTKITVQFVNKKQHYNEFVNSILLNFIWYYLYTCLSNVIKMSFLLLLCFFSSDVLLNMANQE